MGGGSIPEGWLGCPNAGAVVEDTFFAFKTPLSSEFKGRLGKDSYWSPESVFQLAKERNIRIGLWIDLTNTNRYFNKSDIERHAKYVKLKIGGGGEVPSYFAVQEFNSHCQRFLAQNPENPVIAVHCTHGFNRTGYLICSFLVQVKKKLVHEAYSAFTKSRPPGIYRQSYVEKLWEKFSTSDSPSMPSVNEPSWSKRYRNQTQKETNNSDASENTRNALKRRHTPESQGSSTASFSLKRSKTGQEIGRPQFFGSFPRIDYVDDPWLRNNVLCDIQRMCFECSGLGIEPAQDPSYFNEFPGRRGRELSEEALQKLNSDYVVIRTGATSTKYLLLIKTANQVFFIDSANSVFHASGFTFPDRIDYKKKHLTDTLLHGEAMLTTDDNKLIPRFYVQDIIYYYGSPVTQLSYMDRLALIKKEVLDPRISCLKRGIILRRRESQLWLTLQKCWPIENTYKLLQPESCDEITTPVGLKFIFKHEPYKIQAVGYTFDWRRNGKCVNFKIELNIRHRIIDLFVLEMVQPFAWIPINAEALAHNRKVGQFMFHSELQQWHYVGDANTHIPGSYADALAVMSPTLKEVPEDILLRAIEQISIPTSTEGNGTIINE